MASRTTPRVSVVIPTLNRINDIRECVSALEKQDLPEADFEIVVVDGGSTDGTAEFLRGKAAAGAISYLEEKRRGAGLARNLGVMESNAEFIAFTDDDCLPGPGWLSALLAGFPEDGKCGGVGGPIPTLYKKNAVSRYFEHMRIWKDMGFRGKVLHIPTMNALYRRSALLDVGIFDEKVIFAEDIHLSQKVIRKGYHLRNLAQGAVFHKDARDIRTLYRKAMVHGIGIADVARVRGGRFDDGIGSLLRNLAFRKRFAERFAKAGGYSAYEMLAFEFFYRIWVLGRRNGYRQGMRLYLKQIDA